MYCKKCNFYSENYFESCPLCGGPMESESQTDGSFSASIPDWDGRSDGPNDREDFALGNEEEIAATAISASPEHPRRKSEGAASPGVGWDSQGAKDPLPPLSQPEPSGKKTFFSPVKAGIIGLIALGILVLLVFFPAEKSSPPRDKTSKPAQDFTPGSPAPTPGPQSDQVGAGPVAPSPAPLSESPIKTAAPADAEPQSAPLASPPPVGENNRPTGATEPAVSQPQKTASVPVQPPSVSGAPSRPAGQYFIQLGAFKTKENAIRLRDRLHAKGYPVSLTLLTVPGKGQLYRVQAGYYPDRKEAELAAQKLKAEEKISGLMIKPR